jgi:hypothetical protein
MILTLVFALHSAQVLEYGLEGGFTLTPDEDRKFSQGQGGASETSTSIIVKFHYSREFQPVKPECGYPMRTDFAMTSRDGPHGERLPARTKSIF